VAATPLTEVAQRLLANVDAERGDFGDEMLLVAVDSYRNPQRFDVEMERIFRRSPLMVALSCDIPDTGSFTSLDIADRPIVVIRGVDGVARAFINACRHRGAPVVDRCFGKGRRFTCPYHAWVYDTQGKLTYITGPEAFEGIDATGLIELPTAERAGAVFAVLTPGLTFDIDDWLGDMASGLEMLQLDKLFRHDVETSLPSGNWKATADGYVDGYHLGYLHGTTIGTKSITNRNTYDLWGPHLRLGFANKPIMTMRDEPVDTWDLLQAISLVHFIFPNISISGQPNGGLMVSRMFPGPTVDQCRVVQYQYFRQPLVTEEARDEAERKRALYEQVTYEEDFVTVMKIGRRFDALADDVFRFGRNERGNQNLHRWVAQLTA
jgi:phenylpropionate dioxygenase-like ring-hydroxylating dioxygenase large terminal subunit